MVTASDRILIVGAAGQVGTELRRTLAPLGRVLGMDRAEIDLADESAIRSLLRAERPGLVVNAAAYTAVDRAESEPALAHAINARAPAVLAQEAAALGAWLIHYSTDYVYAGDKPGPYVETDPTGPLSVYGASKLAGDQAVAAVGGQHLILRTSWVYGAHGGNFVKTMIRLARERETLAVVSDQVGAPTSAHQIAELTAQIARQLPQDDDPALSGVYHLQGGGEASWHEFAVAVVEQLRQADESSVRCREIKAIPTSAYPTPARRPANSRLDCAKLRRVFGLSPAGWRAELADRFAAILAA
ncbi:MAG TPA: dTDP-4-dehydrorhamnose reductase [Nevskia sp.]|nr:dTDP-4-dehydrorhamnose reductase [Nevskia sp.]